MQNVKVFAHCGFSGAANVVKPHPSLNFAISSILCFQVTVVGKARVPLAEQAWFSSERCWARREMIASAFAASGIKCFPPPLSSRGFRKFNAVLIEIDFGEFQSADLALALQSQYHQADKIAFVFPRNHQQNAIR